MIPWSDKEKAVLLKEKTSAEAVKKYFEKFPQSERTKSSLYTYWWWRKQEEKKNILGPLAKIVDASINTVKDIVAEKVKKEIVKEIKHNINVVHASITGNDTIEVGDMVKFKRTPDAPVGVVINADKKRNIPTMSQTMKVRFGNYYVREVYVCDYKLVKKGGNA